MDINETNQQVIVKQIKTIMTNHGGYLPAVDTNVTTTPHYRHHDIRS